MLFTQQTCPEAHATCADVQKVMPVLRSSAFDFTAAASQTLDTDQVLLTAPRAKHLRAPLLSNPLACAQTKFPELVVNVVPVG